MDEDRNDKDTVAKQIKEAKGKVEERASQIKDL